MSDLSELNQEFQKAMKRLQFGAYSGRIYMDMKQIFAEGYLLGTEDKMGFKAHEEDWGVIEKEQDFGQAPKQLEMF